MKLTKSRHIIQKNQKSKQKSKQKTNQKTNKKTKQKYYLFAGTDININDIKPLMNSRGWKEFNMDKPQQRNPDFLYIDNENLANPKYFKYIPKIQNILDTSKKENSIFNKYHLIEKLKKTNISKKHLLTQIHIDIIKRYDYYQKQIEQLFNQNKVLIFKPIYGTHGDAIEVFDNINNFKTHFNNLQQSYQNLDVGIDKNKYDNLGFTNKMKLKREWVLQQYITNPLLFQGKKFHLRCYLIYHYISINNYKSYLYDNFKVITAEENYIDGDYKNKNIHDTHTHGKLVYLDKSDLIKEFGIENYNNIWNQIKTINNHVGKLIFNDKDHCYKGVKYCYHIYGFDIMIDNNFVVKVIEYNHQPNINMVNGLELYKFCLENIIDKIDL
jgi:hypothetical protein